MDASRGMRCAGDGGGRNHGAEGRAVNASVIVAVVATVTAV